VLKEREYRRER
jgi:hypothetical protein